MKAAIELIKDTFHDWSEDKAARLSASLAYFTIFSLAPLLIIVIAIAGMVLGNREDVQNQILSQIGGMMGQQGSDLIKTMIQNASKPSTSIVASIIGIITLLLGASGVFGQLQDALNTIWGVAPNPKAGLINTLKNRFMSFTMVLGVGFLLLVSLVLSTGLAAVGKFAGGLFPGAELLGHVINFVISFVVITLLFALMYKYVPEAKIAWGDVWIGAVVTALLFTIGKTLIGLYLGKSSPGSTYGAAGSLVVLLVWIYYSGMILFMGAEFTKVYAFKYGSRIVPEDDAVPVTEEARAEEGIPTKQRIEEGAGRKPASGGQREGQSAAPHGAGTDRSPKGERRGESQSAGRSQSPSTRPVGAAMAELKSKGRKRGLAPYALGVGAFMLSLVAFAARRPDGGQQGEKPPK